MRKSIVLLMMAFLIFITLPWDIYGLDIYSDGEKVDVSEEDTVGNGMLRNPMWNEDGTVTWDCVWFGSYWQEDTDGNGISDEQDDKTPIKWRVLSVSEDRILLLSDKVLDGVKYIGVSGGELFTTWENSRVRSWLNGYDASSNNVGKDYSENSFYSNAFSNTEQQCILVSDIDNNNATQGYFNSSNKELSYLGPEELKKLDDNGGNDTKDKIFILSYADVINVDYGFGQDGILEGSLYDENNNPLSATNKRIAKNTGFAKYKVPTCTFSGYEGNGSWYLRSPGMDNTHSTKITFTGEFSSDGDLVKSGIRPALYISNSSEIFKYAGTVCSDWTINEVKKDSSGKEESSLGVTHEDESALTIRRVPVTNSSDFYASSKDNFAPVSTLKKINKLGLDFSKVEGSGVSSNELRLTTIKGAKFKVSLVKNAVVTGGIKAKVKNSTATISAKSNGTVAFEMENGKKYQVSFIVESPKAVKSMKNMGIDPNNIKVLTVNDMFGTSIDSGVLSCNSKVGQASVSDNTVVVQPNNPDSIKVVYQYLNKKYKLGIKVK